MLNLSALDKIIIRFDNIIRNKTSATKKNDARINPSAHINNTPVLSNTERKQSIAMMRVNHSGEVCAQALYKGQALMAKSPKHYIALKQAAEEEIDHLAWCQQRLNELNGNASLLNPIWYAGSFGLGALAGLAGDKISMGFLAETEHQVSKHIEGHLQAISANDLKSRAVLEQMRIDELKHATTAEQHGGIELAKPIKALMRVTAKFMTVTTKII